MPSTTSATATADSSGKNTFTGFGSSPTGGTKTGAGPKVQATALGFGRTFGLAMVLSGVTAGIMWML